MDQACRRLGEPAFAKIQAHALALRGGDQAAPASGISEVAALLQEGIGALDPGMTCRDSREHDIGWQHALEHRRGVDHRKAVADHLFRLLDATLLVADLRDQARRQRGGSRLRTGVLLALTQRLEQITLGHVQA
jgi:hypothetical protein